MKSSEIAYIEGWMSFWKEVDNMKIKRMELTGFGKFHNKTLELSDGLNIIYGENESGKTTIHNFIDGMFYGFLRPNVKSVRYLEEHMRYDPWFKNKYAGILFFIHKGKEYRIEREFTKSNERTKVYREATGEEITDTIDVGGKTRILQPGYYFFGFNSNVYRNTISVKQLQTKTEEALSKEIKEKLVNATHALDEKISVKDAIERLDKDLKDIGSQRAPTSTYGRTKTEINKLKDDIHKIRIKKDDYDGLLRESKVLEEQLNKTIEVLKDVEYLELQHIYDKGMELSKAIHDLEERMAMLKEYLLEDDYKTNQVENYNKIRKGSLIGMGATVIIFLILSNVMDINLIMGVVSFIVLSILGFIFLKSGHMLQAAKKIEEHNLKNYLKLKTDYEINTSQLENKKILYQRVMGNHTLETLRERLNMYAPTYDINIERKASLEAEITNIKLEIARNETNLNNLEKELSSMVVLEEELKDKEHFLQEMDKEIAAIELAKTTIEELSKNIHEDFAPHINKNVSDIIHKITKGKYGTIKVDDKLGLSILNPTSGEILKMDALSGGTIDQLYFALRCGIITSISEENLPLILDDCFIQYDDNRLKSVLELLIDIAQERQIILFTCHNRERELLDMLNTPYNLIGLT